MVRRRFHPIIAFAAIIAAAGSVTAAGLTFTAHTVQKTVAELPQVKQRVLPSYVVRLPEAKAADLDIAKSVEVKPKMSVPVAQVAVAQPQGAALKAQHEVAANANSKPTLVAEVQALPAEDEPAAAGNLYVVKSDVFVRSGPSKRYGQVGTVSGGTKVHVTAQDGGWLKVSFNGRSGWVYQRFLVPAGGGEQVAEADTTGRAPF